MGAGLFLYKHTHLALLPEQSIRQKVNQSLAKLGEEPFPLDYHLNYLAPFLFLQK